MRFDKQIIISYLAAENTIKIARNRFREQDLTCCLSWNTDSILHDNREK